MDDYDDDIELLKFSYVFSKSRNPLKLSCTFLQEKLALLFLLNGESRLLITKVIKVLSLRHSC